MQQGGEAARTESVDEGDAPGWRLVSVGKCEKKKQTKNTSQHTLFFTILGRSAPRPSPTPRTSQCPTFPPNSPPWPTWWAAPPTRPPSPCAAAARRSRAARWLPPSPRPPPACARWGWGRAAWCPSWTLTRCVGWCGGAGEGFFLFHRRCPQHADADPLLVSLPSLGRLCRRLPRRHPRPRRGRTPESRLQAGRVCVLFGRRQVATAPRAAVGRPSRARGRRRGVRPRRLRRLDADGWRDSHRCRRVWPPAPAAERSSRRGSTGWAGGSTTPLRRGPLPPHVGHHVPPQGRPFDPRQFSRIFNQHRGHVRIETRRLFVFGDAAVSRARPDGGPPRPPRFPRPGRHPGRWQVCGRPLLGGRGGGAGDVVHSRSYNAPDPARAGAGRTHRRALSPPALHSVVLVRAGAGDAGKGGGRVWGARARGVRDDG